MNKHIAVWKYLFGKSTVKCNITQHMSTQWETTGSKRNKPNFLTHWCEERELGSSAKEAI
jgi:hypothetical protein